jgi:hypothetical protein
MWLVDRTETARPKADGAPIAGDVTISMPATTLAFVKGAVVDFYEKQSNPALIGCKAMLTEGPLRFEYRIHQGDDSFHGSVDVHGETCQVHVGKRRIVFHQRAPRGVPS